MEIANMSEADISLVNQCLIATPTIKDPMFSSSLIYLCNYNTNGHIGFVINYLSGQNLDRIFDQLDIQCNDEIIRNQPVYIGGPVQLEQGFILHTGNDNWQNSITIAANVHLTSSVDILRAIAAGKGPHHYLVILGFSGWAAGQLESELQENAWLTTSATLDLLFHPSVDHKWQLALNTLGFDISMLSPISGNA